MFVITSILWIALLIFCVNRATKNAYADGYDIGYAQALHDNDLVTFTATQPEPVANPSPPSCTAVDLDAYLNRERIKI